MASLWTRRLRQLDPQKDPRWIQPLDPILSRYHGLHPRFVFEDFLLCPLSMFDSKVCIIDHCTLYMIVHVQNSGVNMCQPIWFAWSKQWHVSKKQVGSAVFTPSNSTPIHYFDISCFLVLERFQPLASSDSIYRHFVRENKAEGRWSFEGYEPKPNRVRAIGFHGAVPIFAVKGTWWIYMEWGWKSVVPGTGAKRMPVSSQ